MFLVHDLAHHVLYDMTFAHDLTFAYNMTLTYDPTPMNVYFSPSVCVFAWQVHLLYISLYNSWYTPIGPCHPGAKSAPGH